MPLAIKPSTSAWAVFIRSAMAFPRVLLGWWHASGAEVERAEFLVDAPAIGQPQRIRLDAVGDEAEAVVQRPRRRITGGDGQQHPVHPGGGGGGDGARHELPGKALAARPGLDIDTPDEALVPGLGRALRDEAGHADQCRPGEGAEDGIRRLLRDEGGEAGDIALRGLL